MHMLQTKWSAEKIFRTPGNVPKPDLLLHEYPLPPGAGCGAPPTFAHTLTTPALKFLRPATANDAGWNGFCQLGWTSCPDAVANKDYSYFWRALGTEWVKEGAHEDKQYCGLNGFLKEDIRSLVHNFTALKAKGEELCRTKYSNPIYGMQEADVYSSMGFRGPLESIKRSGLVGTAKQYVQGLVTGSATQPLFVWDETTAGMTAAGNCALGDLSCNLAYCNWAYCEKADGTYGTMDECEGWDKLHGQL